MQRFLPFDRSAESTVVHEDALDSYGVTVELTRDFGPWKAGEIVTLWFNFFDGIVTEYEPDSFIPCMEHTLTLE